MTGHQGTAISQLSVWRTFRTDAHAAVLSAKTQSRGGGRGKPSAASQRKPAKQLFKAGNLACIQSRHLAFSEENGLRAVVDLVRSHDKNFSADPRGGPWGQSIRNSDAFAEAYANLDLPHYLLTARGMMTALFDRDTAPGAEPEDLMQLATPALIVPGADRAHATSAARYLQECIPRADYWDVAPDEQTEETAPARLIEFLSGVQE